ncbi:hypothetical protein AURDEDRAFT_178216 [Auricularia subglabra TFB-10046 SS5]|uniref:Hydrophobin n=1 Tax=Auricularia subglabra (strain TFB-10046 / SS5) TaxID=717982 RepID=J0CR20_AURST|nr:hypothetical protein AURDEDRAFT_178216 [Auricularia subglabra TFB-10046 SS5]
MLLSTPILPLLVAVQASLAPDMLQTLDLAHAIQTASTTRLLSSLHASTARFLKPVTLTCLCVDWDGRGTTDTCCDLYNDD